MELYKGYRTVTQEEYDKIYTKEDSFIPNEYLFLNNQVYRCDGSPLAYTKLKDFTAKNLEQRVAFDLLDNDDIKVKFLYGIAGSGKTKSAIQYGLTKVAKHKYDGLFVVRNPVPVGDTLGLYSGNKEDKLKNWINPVLDNMPGGQEGIMMARYKVSYDVPSDMQGRDLKRQFIIVDEAQQLTKEQIKMIGSRVSEGSVIVFCGDVEQTFDKRFKDDKNGLSFAIQELKNQPEVGVVYLTESVRGRVAELFANLKI